jgi:hypothetical protein
MSKLRLKCGEPLDDIFIILERALEKLMHLWDAADLQQMPMVDSLWQHAVK